MGRAFTEELRLLFHPGRKDEHNWNSNESPRDTVLTFVNGMEAWLYGSGTEEEFKRVQKTLPPGFTPDSPEVRDLKKVFDRLGSIPPIDLPGVEEIKREDRNSLEVFPYAIDHDWVWEVIDETPDGSIVVTKDQENGEWRFDKKTLSDAEALLRSVSKIPPKFLSSGNKQVVDRVFSPMFQDSPWWSWLILVVALVIAVLAARWIRNRLVALGKHLEENVAVSLGNLVRGLALSVAIVVAVVIAIIGTSYVEFSPLIADFVWLFVRIILLVALVGVFLCGIDLVIGVVRNRLVSTEAEYREMTLTMVQRILRSIIILGVLFFIMENALGVHVGALLTGLGVVGLALSLAGKESAANLFGAVSIFLNRPFVVGDWIEFKDALGEVRDVRMQATYLRLLSGEMMIIPNQQFVSYPVSNLGMRKYLRRKFDIALTYSTTPEQVDHAIELLQGILRSDEVVESGKCDLEEKAPVVSFSGFGDYSLNLKVYYWYHIGDDGEELQRNHERGWFSYLDHCTIVNRAILEAFNKHGIDFAFPTQTVELETASESDNLVGASGAS